MITKEGFQIHVSVLTMLYTMISAIAIVIDYISQCHRYVNASWSKEWEGRKEKELYELLLNLGNPFIL